MLWICSLQGNLLPNFGCPNRKKWIRFTLSPETIRPQMNRRVLQSLPPRPRISNFYWRHNPSRFVKTQIGAPHSKRFRFSSSATSIKWCWRHCSGDYALRTRHRWLQTIAWSQSIADKALSLFLFFWPHLPMSSLITKCQRADIWVRDTLGSIPDMPLTIWGLKTIYLPCVNSNCVRCRIGQEQPALHGQLWRLSRTKLSAEILAHGRALSKWGPQWV